MLPAADHPIWPVLRVGLLVIALGLCLKFNYSTFDPIKDPRAMLIMAIVGFGLEFGKRWLTARAG